MEQNFLRALAYLGGTAVIIQDGALAWVSEDAKRLGMEVGMAADTLFPDGVTVEQFAELVQFSLPAPWDSLYAKVCPLDGAYMLVLSSDVPPLTYDALAQTSKMVREPMDDIMPVAQSLFAQLEEMDNPLIQSQTASLTRGFYRLLRAASSLTDMEQSRFSTPLKPARTDLLRWLRELGEPLTSVTAATGRSLAVSLPKGRLYAEIHAPLLEQALLCLLSNAIAYSPAGAPLRIRLWSAGGQCLFTVENPIREPVSLTELSGGFAANSAGTHGPGLGLLRVQHIARRFGGTLLLECTPDGLFRANLRIPERHDPEQVRIVLPQISEGGYNRMLVELSGVLPDSVFDSRGL